MHLNTAQKCIKRVRPAKGHIIRPLFNAKSPNFIYKDIQADLVFSYTGYYVTSNFQSAFIEIREKRPKMPSPTALGLILVAFCLPH